MSFGREGLFRCRIRGSETSGAGFADERRRHFARVEGEPDGSRTTRTTKPISGQRNGSCGPRFSDFEYPWHCARMRYAVTAVAHGQQAAERHQHAAAPDPVDEGFEIDAHDPGASGRSLSIGSPSET